MIPKFPTVHRVQTFYRFVMRSAIPKTSLAQLADSLYRSTDLIYSAETPIPCSDISNILIIINCFNIKIHINMLRPLKRSN